MYWPTPPHDPQGIRVASGFEFSVCLSVCVSACLFVLCKFSNLFVDYKAAGVRKNVVRKNVANLQRKSKQTNRQTDRQTDKQRIQNLRPL